MTKNRLKYLKNEAIEDVTAQRIREYESKTGVMVKFPVPIEEIVEHVDFDVWPIARFCHRRHPRLNAQRRCPNLVHFPLDLIGLQASGNVGDSRLDRCAALRVDLRMFGRALWDQPAAEQDHRQPGQQRGDQRQASDG